MSDDTFCLIDEETKCREVKQIDKKFRLLGISENVRFLTSYCVLPLTVARKADFPGFTSISVFREEDNSLLPEELIAVKSS